MPVGVISDVTTDHPESARKNIHIPKKSSGIAQNLEFLIH